IMTGTGFINDPSEIWNLLDFLGGRDLVPSFNKFKATYCKMERQGPYLRVAGILPHMKDEFIGITRRVGVRRTLTETHPNIAEPFFTRINVELNAIQRKMYDDLMDQLSTLDQQGVPLHAANVLVLLNRLRQVTVATPKVVREYPDPETGARKVEIELVEPSSKLDALMELIEGLEWDNDPDGIRQQLVVFSNFKDPINLACARFKKAGISYIRMDASDSESVRYHKWKVEWPKKEHQVFICTLQLGSESINLSSAQRCVFLDRSWSPKDNIQGIGRVRRPGQLGVTQVINIEAEGTVDQYVEGKVNRKTGWFKEIFHPEDNGNGA
ncbi:MAG TPA: DEAD/DEAH box helicase, partial [Ktedonobacteraceae bacterium]